MILLTLLALIGVLLIILEILLPGFGLFGISGSIALILVITLTTVKYSFAALAILLCVSLLFAILFFHFMQSKKEKFILHDAIKTKDFDETILQDLEGKQGITLTTLQPYGMIEVEGKKIDVTSNEGYIDKNQTVQVIQVKGKAVIVKKILKEDSHDIY